MFFRNLVLFVAMILVVSCKSNDVVYKTTYSLELKEYKGVQSYQSGDYKEAFELLKEPAAWGYKSAQYALAFMFLKGQHVKQSTLLGMGWLGVAKEANVKEWTQQFNGFYAASSSEDRLRFDNIVDLYIERYGLKAQDITCTKTNKLGSRQRVISCHHYNGVGVLYDIDVIE